ncbi:Rieske 2Fe-2S domain-containing protein [Candidatus Woesearchaeota archaeon]|nr:Rieske 2Fe-2S domain-containing protein [Candidatus Woesearchaeota archaeon]
MVEFIKVASKSEIRNGYGKVIDINGKSIALMNNNEKFFAVENTCKHMGGPLGEGNCEDGKVICPWHGWSYDLKTGKNTFNEEIKLETYEVKIDGENILIKI